MLSGVRLVIQIDSKASKRSFYKTKQCSNTRFLSVNEKIICKG